jgi:Immunoglobulin I-set domain
LHRLEVRTVEEPYRSWITAVFLCLVSAMGLGGCAGVVGTAVPGNTPNPASAPSITTEPSNQTVVVGQTGSFSVVAAGTAPLSYQWKKNGAAIVGASSSGYVTPPLTTSDDGAQFTVTVANSAGNVTSSAATLTVNAAAVAPSITTQPTSQTVTVGQTASFSVAAAGTGPLSYQWKKNGAAIVGATSSGYVTPPSTASDNGAQFAVTVTNSAGNVSSSAATLTVNAAAVAPSITTEPSNQTVVVGQTGSFAVVAVGTAPLNYQWKKNGAAIAGASSSVYVTPPLTTSDNGAQFTVTVSLACEDLGKTGVHFKRVFEQMPVETDPNKAGFRV